MTSRDCHMISSDSTLRLWDVNEPERQLNVVKGRDKQGRKSAVSTCAFSRDGKMIAAGLVDGSIQLWKSNGPFVSVCLCVCVCECVSV